MTNKHWKNAKKSDGYPIWVLHFHRLTIPDLLFGQSTSQTHQNANGEHTRRRLQEPSVQKVNNLWRFDAIFSYFSVLLPTVINSLTISRYPSVLERVLGIHPVFAQRQSIRQVSFEFMTRELLWHGFAVSIFRLWPYTKIFKKWPNTYAEHDYIICITLADSLRESINSFWSEMSY